MQQSYLKLVFLSVCAALIGFGPVAGHATTYYVSPSGSDTNRPRSTEAHSPSLPRRISAGAMIAMA